MFASHRNHFGVDEDVASAYVTMEEASALSSSLVGCREILGSILSHGKCLQLTTQTVVNDADQLAVVSKLAEGHCDLFHDEAIVHVQT